MLRNPIKDIFIVTGIVIAVTKGFIEFVKYYEKKNKN